MVPLNLPAYDFKLQRVGEMTMIFDPVRRKYVRLTPEEWVRQHFIQYLIREQGFPAPLLAIEKGFTYRRMRRRADVVAYDRQGKPLLMAECKAPGVAVQQATFDQVARYNTVVQAKYLVITNGLVHYCWVVDRGRQAYQFLDALPSYEAA